MSAFIIISNNWFARILLILVSFFILQSNVIAVTSSTIIFGQEHHTIISKTYTYDEIESSIGEEGDRTGGLSRVLTTKEAWPDHEVLINESRVAAKGAPKYLYHYTSREAAQSISQSGLRVGRDGFSYLTNTKSLSPLQAQIELALPANRALPNSLLRINTSGLSPAAIRRVQGNLPGLGAGGGTEFLFNQHFPASAIKIIR